MHELAISQQDPGTLLSLGELQDTGSGTSLDVTPILQSACSFQAVQKSVEA